MDRTEGWRSEREVSKVGLGNSGRSREINEPFISYGSHWESLVKIFVGDCITIPYPDKFFDLTFTSPPYEDAGTYEMGFRLRGKDWVDWAIPRFLECLRVTKGLTCWVMAGRTRAYRWSGTPVLLQAKLLELGVNLRNPPVAHRVGIPGSGGPDWWRSDYETIVCATHGGKLPWSDNTATGHPPKYPVGGKLSYRTQDGRRVNAQLSKQPYRAPTKANPGNVIKIRVGGGHLGSALAHENEAPFAEALVEPFVRCFCRPNGVVLDPFVGSGTTVAVAERLGRHGIGMDIRQSQVDLAKQRVREQMVAGD